ncbi:NADH-quinone oxidoreductase subunit B family protein [Ancylobacter terrae]|uniref:NADH-quinone oxidoreductase subunit B family protein n=1 Tax=Ancylobacter sp. sgz301288 TaxID=3342077 RepID=UPI00385A3E06
MSDAATARAGGFNVLWIQSGGCGGCTMSLLCAEAPDLVATLASADIRLLWHPTLSEETGAEALVLFDRIIAGDLRLDALCVEGALLRGPNNTGRFHILAGTGVPTIDWVRRLAARARHVVAVGTCAAYGGVTAAGVNPTDACGLQYDGRRPGGALGAEFRAAGGLPVINVAGCPTHPNWITETLMLLAADLLGAGDLDVYGRPRFYADHLVHHGCPRNEYYEYKASAEKLSDLGCMMEHLGCVGTQAHADCNTRLWNGEGSCTRGGYACINCTAPEFEEPGHAFLETPKIAGIPVGLPTDMPKAWFVALSSLAKAATPDRLRRNAVSDHVVTPPAVRDLGRR